MSDYSPEYLKARQKWWDCKSIYAKELEKATHFYELEKSLFIINKLSCDKHCTEDQAQFEMLEDTETDMQLRVLNICEEFAKKKITLDKARKNMHNAEKDFDMIRKEPTDKK